MGVFNASSRLMNAGELTIGLSISEGKVPDPGVCKEEVALGLLSKPAAAMVAVAVADAMLAYRRLRQRVTEESNE